MVTKMTFLNVTMSIVAHLVSLCAKIATEFKAKTELSVLCVQIPESISAPHCSRFGLEICQTECGK